MKTDSECESTAVLPNVWSYVPEPASYPRRLGSLPTLLWEPQILQWLLCFVMSVLCVIVKGIAVGTLYTEHRRTVSVTAYV
jgi:hypothetical protein